MYTLPLAGFIVQLEGLPPQWQETERSLMVTLFPGARSWASASLLRQLKGLGFAAEMPDPFAMALGAKCRVYWWEHMACGGLWIGRRTRRLSEAIDATTHLDRAAAWRGWVASCFFSNVLQAQRQLEVLAASAQLSVDLLLQGSSADPTPKHQWQRRCIAVLRHPDAQGLHCHLRARLDRWHLQLLPGHRVRRMEAALACIGALVPPCVCAATLKAMLDGWTTADSRRQTSQCLFGCQQGRDGIMHYAYCPCVARLASARLRLQPAPAAARLDDFLLLHGQPGARHLALRALCLYATFMATNAVRNGKAAVAGDAWIQAMVEGASRDPPLAGIVRTLWRT